jgi:FixJ family two-component response regulator
MTIAVDTKVSYGSSTSATYSRRMGTLPRLLISVVDDDESLRESLPDLLRQFDFDVQTFASAEEFLASSSVEHTRCLILDVAMPGMNGPALQQELRRQDRYIPIVFITAHTDERLCAEVLAAGAVACLFKPFSESAIVNAVSIAVKPVERVT